MPDVDRSADQISERVSKDGGATFGGTSSWATSDVDNSAVAAGKGVVYVAYLGRGGALRVPRPGRVAHRTLRSTAA